MNKAIKMSLGLILIFACAWLHPGQNPSSEKAPNRKKSLESTLHFEAPTRSQDDLQAAVARFQARTASISRQSIVEEQERIRAAREQYEHFEDDEPHTDIIQDEYGMKWRRLSYSDGRVRYEWSDQG